MAENVDDAFQNVRQAVEKMQINSKEREVIEELLSQFEANRAEKYVQQIMIYHVLEKQEEKRRWLSHYLYHIIGQSLYSIMVWLHVTKGLDMDDSIAPHLRDVEQIVNHTLEKVKYIADEMYPLLLEDLGLIPAIRSYATRFEKNCNIKIDCIFFINQQRYNRDIEITLYRIFQDALLFMSGDAKAKAIFVSLHNSQEKIELIIRGTGAIPDEKIQKMNVPLYLIQERAKRIDGFATIYKDPGTDLLLTITIPLSNKENRSDNLDGNRIDKDG